MGVCHINSITKFTVRHVLNLTISSSPNLPRRGGLASPQVQHSKVVVPTYECNSACLGYDFEFRGIVWQAVSEIRFYNDIDLRVAVSFETTAVNLEIDFTGLFDQVLNLAPSGNKFSSTTLCIAKA